MKFIDIPSNGANYLKLKPGELAKGVFRGEPVIYRVHWVNQRSVLCPEGGCGLCSKGERSAFRFKVNFVVLENKAFTAKIWEAGKAVYESLKALHEGEYNLERYKVKITRNGSGTETTYSIIPIPDGHVNDELEKVLKGVVLNELTLPATLVVDKEGEPF